jgi:hypothetical protein
MGPEQRKYTFRQPVILIGRDKECDLCLTEETKVSRQHLKIFRDGEKWYIEDLDSLNGTTLNGMPINPRTPTPLEEFDLIKLANSVSIIFRISDLTESFTGLPDEGSSQWQECAQKMPCTETGATLQIITRESTDQKRDRDNSDQPKCMPAPNSCFPGRNMSDSASSPPRPISSCPQQSPSCPPRSAKHRSPRAESPRSRDKQRGAFWFLQNAKNRNSPQPDDIQFRAAAPANLNPGHYFLVKIMAYPEADYERADREQKTLADYVRFATSSIFQANRMDTFRIRIFSEDFSMEEKMLTLTWNGKYASAETDILLPADYAGDQLRLIARVYSDIRVLTDLILILQVQASRPQEVKMKKRPVKTAFVSYASKDLDKVLPRIQGLLLGQQDMDLFLDRKDLIRGEHWEPRLYREIEARDIFYLFWSNNARNSIWVQKELAYAIEKKGLMAIEPVPLEDPFHCPPPEQLQDRHFNDWPLRYMSQQ